MSKADKLGGGTSFQRASAIQVGPALSDRGRAKAVAEGRIPSYAIVKIPLAEVSPTPLNPRRNFGSAEEQAHFGEELRQAQQAACVVVTRTAYLSLWPDHAAQIGDAEYVLVNGERRFRSAKRAELLTLDFVIRDEFADSREEFLNRLLKENLDRADFDLVERATGVQQLVDVCAEQSGWHGAQARAAEQLGKSRAWITNQLALLTLPEEIRASVSSGEVSGRDAVWMSRRLKDSPTALSGEELSQLLAVRKAQETEAKAQKNAILQSAAAKGLLTAVNNCSGDGEVPTARSEARPDSQSDEAEVLTAVNNSVPAGRTPTPPEQPSEALTAVTPSTGRTATSVPHPINESALRLRQHLGATPKEQADNIVQALSAEELKALIEELYSRI
ncbi:ParB/RepB/Spo0J family partition protein (plasmid) [Streptomyces sp. JL4002]|uniref:ParB/RepB/Spo0J family partition protein n=1 Tax=Streptomyces sp. JL4002 TaxID=3404781 RepID=UPI003B2840FB